MSFHSIFAILHKDLIDVIRSKAVWISLSVHVILSLFFTLAFSTPDLLPELGLYDPGNSGFENFIKKTGSFNVYEVKSEEEGRLKLNKEKWAGVIILPPEFDSSIRDNTQPRVQLLIDNSLMSRAQVLLIGLSEVFRLYARQSYPVILKVETVRKTGLKSCQEMLPLWVLLTVMGSLVVTTSSLMEEKDKKTLYALLVSPASIYDVLIGKGLLGVILTFISSVILLLLNNGLTGNLFFLLTILLSGAICFSIWGIFVALISPAQTTANSINSLIFIFLMIPLVLGEKSSLLSGMSRFLPSYYLVDGMRRSMQGDSALLYIHFIVLGIFSFTLFFLCLRIISRQESY